MSSAFLVANFSLYPLEAYSSIMIFLEEGVLDVLLYVSHADTVEKASCVNRVTRATVYTGSARRRVS